MNLEKVAIGVISAVGGMLFAAWKFANSVDSEKRSAYIDGWARGKLETENAYLRLYRYDHPDKDYEFRPVDGETEETEKSEEEA